MIYRFMQSQNQNVEAWPLEPQGQEGIPLKDRLQIRTITVFVCMYICIYVCKDFMGNSMQQNQEQVTGRLSGSETPIQESPRFKPHMTALPSSGPSPLFLFRLVGFSLVSKFRTSKKHPKG